MWIILSYLHYFMTGKELMSQFQIPELTKIQQIEKLQQQKQEPFSYVSLSSITSTSSSSLSLSSSSITSTSSTISSSSSSSSSSSTVPDVVSQHDELVVDNVMCGVAITMCILAFICSTTVIYLLNRQAKQQGTSSSHTTSLVRRCVISLLKSDTLLSVFFLIETIFFLIFNNSNSLTLSSTFGFFFFFNSIMYEGLFISAGLWGMFILLSVLVSLKRLILERQRKMSSFLGPLNRPRTLSSSSHNSGGETANSLKQEGGHLPSLIRNDNSRQGHGDTSISVPPSFSSSSSSLSPNLNGERENNTSQSNPGLITSNNNVSETRTSPVPSSSFYPNISNDMENRDSQYSRYQNESNHVNDTNRNPFYTRWIIYNVVAWTLPLIDQVAWKMALWSMIRNETEIKDEHTWLIFYTVFFYFHVILMFTIEVTSLSLCFIIYQKVRSFISKANFSSSGSKNGETHRKIIKKLTLYVIPFLFCNIWILSYRCFSGTNKLILVLHQQPPGDLYLLILKSFHRLLFPIQGILNVLIYTYSSKQFQRQILSMLCCARWNGIKQYRKNSIGNDYLTTSTQPLIRD